MKAKRYEGFSLIEILVVVALIIILATITIVAINPGKNFRDTRNAQRSSDVNTILSAITQFTTTDGNALPAGVTACDETEPDGWRTGADIGTDGVDLTFLTTGENDYMVAVPKDPQGGTDANTGYTICTIGTRVQIAAPKAFDDGGKKIVVKR